MRIRTIVSIALATVGFGMLSATVPAQAAPAQAVAVATSYGPFQFKNDFSHLCMEMTFGSTADGGRVQQWDCYNQPPVQWRLDLISTINGVGYYQFVNVNSNKCLDVPNGSTAAGVELQQWTCWSGDMQQWALFQAGGNSFTIRNLKSGLCVDVKDWGGAGAPLQQWHCNGLAVQTWQFA